MVQNATVSQQNDRVSFSFGMKLLLPTKYESADFHISLTSDVGLGENLDQALARIKAKIADEAYKLYNQIRDSKTGLLTELTVPNQTGGLSEQSKNTGNVPASTEVQTEQTIPTKAKDPKVLRQQIKHAYGVLELQNKITKADFAIKYLGSMKEKVLKLSQEALSSAIEVKIKKIEDEEVLQIFNLLKTNFKELGL